MSRRGNGDKVYIGDLPRDASEREIEKACREFGAIRSVWVARNPPGFAFVEFEDSRDADAAVRELDGSVICGVRARVEISSGRSRPKPWLRDDDRRGGGNDRSGSSSRRPFNPDDKCYECGERGHYAYDCRLRKGGGSRRRSRSRSRSRSRGRSRSRS